MTTITTLSQFLTTARMQYQVYDLGRRVLHIDNMAFHQIEALTSPYPYPIQGHAQFAMVFWRDNQAPFIWFIKLALDEQGLLSPSPRAQFMQMILTALGDDPSKPLTQEQQERLTNHPFSFTPSQEKLAVFNALVRQQRQLPPSNHYAVALQYLTHMQDERQWQQVGIQGLADICVRATALEETNQAYVQTRAHEQALLNGFNVAPIEIHIALCQCLEHVLISDALADKLLTLLMQASNQNQHYYLRALASRPIHAQQALMYLHKHLGTLTTELLISIAGRNWSLLKHAAFRELYLNALAEQSQTFFNQVFADIVALPSLRAPLLATLRSPNRSVTLSKAIGGLFQAVTP